MSVDGCAGHESTVALVPQLRETVKFETARRIFYSLPDQLTKGAGGKFYFNCAAVVELATQCICS